MKKITVAIFMMLVILITFNSIFKNSILAEGTLNIQELSNTGKYFKDLDLVKDSGRNFSYYLPKSLQPGGYSDFDLSFYKEDDSNNSFKISYVNTAQYSQLAFKGNEYLASFIPGDSLEKWVTNVYNGRKKAGVGDYEIVEKQSDMYIVKVWHGNEKNMYDYELCKISNGIPLCMDISATGKYSKEIDSILSEAKILFENFSTVKSYSENPTIGYYIICIGSYKDKAFATKMEDIAKSKGLTVYINTEEGRFNVNIGSFRVKSNAENGQNVVREKGFDSYLYYKLRK